MQYTLRGIPPSLDSELRRRASAEGKSLNRLAIEALILGVGLRGINVGGMSVIKMADLDQRCHLMFLSAAPDAARREALMALQGEDYRFHVRGKVLYYTYPREYAGRRRTIDFEKVLGVTGTARIWNVVDQLIELSA